MRACIVRTLMLTVPGKAECSCEHEIVMGGHDYLEPLEALADERPVVFYDQLGAGKSDALDDVTLWTNERP
jgi:hypothetical protein